MAGGSFRSMACRRSPAAVRFLMPRSFLLLLVLGLALSGCVTLNSRDRHFLESRGVTSGPIYDKMMHHEPLTADEIVELTQRGVPGRFLVHYLQPTYQVYKLSAGDVMRLRQAHAEEGLIRYLQSTPGMYSPASIPDWYGDDPHVGDPYWNYLHN
jgi:hypothetical protein